MKSNVMGFPVQGTELFCAIGLHALALLCVFGLQTDIRPQGDGPVLMAEWISAENAPPVHESNSQTPEPVKRAVNPPGSKPKDKPLENKLLTTQRLEPSQDLTEAKPEPRLENQAVNNTEFSADKNTDMNRDESKPIPAAYSPPASRASNTDRSASGGKSAAMASMNPDYLAELFRKLGRHKVYPSELKKNKIEGRVFVKFTLAADGRVMSSSIQQSSGNDSLDAAALQMLNKASPLPAIPSWMNRQEMTLAVPVEYSLLTDR